jgi:DNA polymerase delta subunit 3
MTDALMTRLTTATTEEGKTVTYKWVAREFDVPVNHAKRLLFAHASKNDSVLVATHVVSGWTSVAGGDDGAGITRTQVVRLVEGAEALAAAKAALDEVTGEHVYSVRPVDAKDATVGGDSKSLPPACVAQTDAMFDASPSTPNALRDNRHSAVRCASAKRDDGPARRVAAKPKPSTAKKPEPPKTSAKAEPAAATAGKAGPPAAPASSKPSGGKSKPPGAFAGFKPVDKNAAVAPKPTAKPAGKGAGAMAAMFARAPPKKAAAAATAATAATAAATTPAPVPAEEDSDEEEEEEIMEAPRHRRGGGRRVLGLDEEEDEAEDEDEEEAKATAKAASPAKKTDAKKTATKKASTPTPAAKAKNKRKSVETADATTVETSPPVDVPAQNAEDRAASKRPKKETPKPLFAKSAASAKEKASVSGARVKKVVTVMDEETGEELTKTIWVDRDTGEEVEETPMSASAGVSALEEKTNAKKSSAPRSPAKAKASSAAAKSGGIASFFGKK